MTRTTSTLIVSLSWLTAPHARADHFDDHSLPVLQGVERRADVHKPARFTLGEIAALPKVIQGAPQSVLLVVKTDEGNWSKLLVRAGGLRRKGSAQPQPFLHVERLVTYAANPRRGVLADKRELYLFDGLALDLDIGQVVRKGEGSDLSFEGAASSEKGAQKSMMMDGELPKLGPLLGMAVAGVGVGLFIPGTPLVAASKVGAKTKTSGAIAADDFAGKYRLDVDGRFTGMLTLRAEGGRLVGSFASDQTGAAYDVSGSNGNPAHRLALTIAFPRTDLKIEGRLFTRARTRIAGSATMEDNTFGFVADRTD